MIDETAEVRAAREQLEQAIKVWLRAKAAPNGETQPADARSADPILLNWALVTGYTSLRLEELDATACAYECAEGQPSYTSRGLVLQGVDHW